MEQRQNNIKNRETNIKDMCLACLEKASIIGVVAIIFAIVFGILGYTSEKKSIENAKAYVAQYEESELVEENTLDEDGELTDSEMELVETYLACEESYQEWLYYSQNSPLMKVDPNAMPITRLGYYLSIPEEESVNSEQLRIIAMKEAYTSVMEGEIVKEKIENLLGTDKANFFSEYINLRSASSTSNGAGMAFLFDIEIYGETEEECRQIATLVEETVEEYSKVVTEKFGSHSMDLVSNDLTIEASSSYVQNKKDKLNTLIDAKAKYTSLKNELNEKQMKYLGMDIEDPEDNTEDVEEDANTSPEVLYQAQKEIANGQPHINLVMVIVGALCGIILSGIVVCVSYLQNSKISVYDNYEQIFQAKLLGVLFDSEEKKKGIVRFIETKRLKNVHIMNKEKHSAYTLEVIKSELEKYKGSKCIIVSCEKLEQLINLSGELKSVLKDCEYLPEILTDAEAYGKLKMADAVIVAEKAGKTPYWAIAKELDLIENENKKIVGTILFD